MFCRKKKRRGRRRRKCKLLSGNSTMRQGILYMPRPVIQASGQHQTRPLNRVFSEQHRLADLAVAEAGILMHGIADRWLLVEAYYRNRYELHSLQAHSHNFQASHWTFEMLRTPGCWLRKHARARDRAETHSPHLLFIFCHRINLFLSLNSCTSARPHTIQELRTSR